MAEQLPNAPFPAPPPFYSHFTKPNIARLRQLRREAGVPVAPIDATADATSKEDIDIFALPVELRHLIPPEPQADGKYTVFGNAIDPDAAERSLAERDVEQLYPSDGSVRLNPQPHLIGLTRSMLTTFLALAGILSQNPELYEEKVKDIHTIAMNIHELINQYRPHQARETLIMMLEERVDKMKKESQDIDQAKAKVVKLLQDIQDMQRTHAPKHDERNMRDGMVQVASVTKRKARQRAAWATLRQEVM
ncbi:hypothetical protein CLAFUW4_01548 [Fulvia fulva]|uniref:Mediator of RNA polymerase II transcription subunit 7 n=1 Tax=Passalora fulva TaxID=5499 RepID=A0A9Q8L5S3_PASFU|nr:Mediator of RNA polymerase II transcription subunit 7 [Fulvia fulva]KAK4634610.1 hypothetical protein CLAFUR4_01547 [Fulvia fulva]KAK4638067.1 hypothetical protein CLAFUR0_01548 [Fulvia fulva]UJO11329.1 Mediator of RNA polymerase II transcription subunit 7 [Fulvia fulva]WPV09626.1 hypothetical protein CLAFUW4_01546 [Fulvia fulva]WPV09636.1 hypothetical protein CLAFUW4_01548 [Fulvia fulva]